MTWFDVLANALLVAVIWTPCVVALIALVSGDWPWQR